MTLPGLLKFALVIAIAVLLGQVLIPGKDPARELGVAVLLLLLWPMLLVVIVSLEELWELLWDRTYKSSPEQPPDLRKIPATRTTWRPPSNPV